MLKKMLASTFSAVALVAAAPAHAVSVGLELVLLVDVSGSVDATEYALQKTGYVQAFQNAAVQAAIMNSVGGGIAVTYVEWSGATAQSQAVGWTLINDAASANAFAASLNAVSRTSSGNTAIQTAMDYGYKLFGTETGFASNGFESQRQVIDVSGDGARNEGLTGTIGRDNALNAGVDTINGLAILGEAGLQTYYQDNVIGGGGFLEIANDFADFARAIERKLVREITGTPEPASLALVGLGLLGVGVARRRGRKA